MRIQIAIASSPSQAERTSSANRMAALLKKAGFSVLRHGFHLTVAPKTEDVQSKASDILSRLAKPLGYDLVVNGRLYLYRDGAHNAVSVTLHSK